VDVGWYAVLIHSPLVVGGELLVLLALEGREATVKVYGVAVAMPQG
jgi:hypothetical protein